MRKLLRYAARPRHAITILLVGVGLTTTALVAIGFGVTLGALTAHWLDEHGYLVKDQPEEAMEMRTLYNPDDGEEGR